MRVALVVAVSVGALAPSARAAPTLERPVTSLEVVPRRVGAPEGPARVEGERVTGATLLLSSMSEDARRDVARRLARLAAALERRRNPLFVALDDGPERAETEALARDLGPAFAAASALSAGTWTSSDGDLTVRGVRSCAPGATCIPIAGPARRDGVEGRARFLAWPIGFGVVVRGPAASDAPTIAEAVRGHRAPDSTIALVLTDRELHHLRQSRGLDALARDAARVLRTLGDRAGAVAGLLRALADAPRAGNEAAWLELPRGAVLIAPRLSALAKSDAFAGEVRAALAGTPALEPWLASPEPRPGAPAPTGSRR